MIYETVDLRETIDIIIGIMATKAKSKQIGLFSEVHPDVP